MQESSLVDINCETAQKMSTHMHSPRSLQNLSALNSIFPFHSSVPSPSHHSSGSHLPHPCTLPAPHPHPTQLPHPSSHPCQLPHPHNVPSSLTLNFPSSLTLTPYPAPQPSHSHPSQLPHPHTLPSSLTLTPSHPSHSPCVAEEDEVLNCCQS